MTDLYAGQWDPSAGFGQNTPKTKPPPGFGGQSLGQFGIYGGGSSPAALGDANNIRGLAGGMAGAFKGDLGYADQALKDAFDPNKSNFNQQMSDLTDQTRAGEAARGIGMSPYGAGVEANTQGRFRNDWQTAQVGREATGAATAEGLQGQWAAGQGQAAGMYAQAAGISQNDVANQLKAYGLQGDALARAQQAMLQYMLGEDTLNEKRDEYGDSSYINKARQSGAAGFK